jgi:hypothetical protein
MLRVKLQPFGDERRHRPFDSGTLAQKGEGEPDQGRRIASLFAGIASLIDLIERRSHRFASEAG